MKRLAGAVLLGSFLAASAGAASLDGLGADGWHTWRVEAVEGAPAWCCFSRRGDAATARTCKLDQSFGYGNCDGAVLDGFVQVYAKMESGEPVEVRVLAPGCPVEAEAGVTDLGEIDTGASFAWLGALVRLGSGLGEDALAAVAMHRGDRPRRFLVDKALGGAEDDIRAAALFWLATTGADEGEEVIMRAIAGDPDRDVREQAVFALSQLPGERAVDALSAVLRDRGLGHDVRKQALFWLAQSESDRALAIVERLLAGTNASRP